MRPRRLFLTAPRGERERELPPATTARGTCSWPPGTSLPPSSPGRGERGDRFWLRMKLLLPTGRAWGSSPRFSPLCALHQRWLRIPCPPAVAQVLSLDDVAKGNIAGRSHGCSGPRGFGGVGGCCPVLPHRLSSPLLCKDWSQRSPSCSLQERGGPRARGTSVVPLHGSA